MKFNTIDEILSDIAAGKMVIILDDEDRENEGDLLMAAEKVTASDINFMATYGRGLVCMPISRERCQQLELPLMVSKTTEKFDTPFTVSIEAAQGVTTGISAADRAATIQAAVAVDASPKSIVQPGHIFPLMAQPGGVLTRAGHTEAGCDLARLAGFEPAAAIVEILNEDGTMARRDDLFDFATKHQLKIGTIEDLIRYRVKNEKTIEKIQENVVNTVHGEFNIIAFRENTQQNIHLAMVKGAIVAEQETLVRVHIENELCDMLLLQEDTCGWPLRDAMQRIAEAEQGVIIILRNDNVSRTEDILAKLALLSAQPDDADKSDKEAQRQSTEDVKTFGIGAQILSELGVQKMRVMSAPKHYHGLAGFGLEIVDYVQD